MLSQSTQMDDSSSAPPPVVDEESSKKQETDSSVSPVNSGTISHLTGRINETQASFKSVSVDSSGSLPPSKKKSETASTQNSVTHRKPYSVSQKTQVDSEPQQEKPKLVEPPPAPTKKLVPETKMTEPFRKATAKEIREQREKRKNMTCGQKFKKWIYDGETKQFFGKTCADWGKLMLFYIIYYVILLGIFFGLLSLAQFLTRSDTAKLGYSDGLIGQPEIAIRPFGDKGGVIRIYNSTDDDKKTGNDKHADEIRTFLHSDKYKSCKGCLTCGKDDLPSSEDDVCMVLDGSDNWEKKIGGDCVRDSFGYFKGKPCMLFRLANRFGWYPEEDERRNCSGKFLHIACNHTNRVDSPSEPANVTYFSMDGDMSTEQGRISYCFFPFHNQPSYQNPLVMAQFEIPITMRDKPLEFHCWISKNDGKNLTEIDTRGQVTVLKLQKSATAHPVISFPMLPFLCFFWFFV